MGKKEIIPNRHNLRIVSNKFLITSLQRAQKIKSQQDGIKFIFFLYSESTFHASISIRHLLLVHHNIRRFQRFPYSTDNRVTTQQCLIASNATPSAHCHMYHRKRRQRSDSVINCPSKNFSIFIYKRRLFHQPLNILFYHRMLKPQSKEKTCLWVKSATVRVCLIVVR